jgi:diguanylate cyclase (GGDEF)-like protein/PAS domain S-box-containing protein
MIGSGFRVVSFIREHALGCAIGVALLYWVLDALVHSSGGGEGFLAHLVSTEAHTVVPRLFTVALLFSLGFLLRAERLRRRSEAKVRASEQRFRTLAGSSPVGFFECDASGRWVYVNDRTAALLGLPGSACLGEGYATALHQDDRERVLRRWAEAVREGRPLRVECRFSHRDAEVVWTICEAAPLLGDDAVATGFIGTITDITERVKVETELLERTRLAELSAATGQILAEEATLPGMLQRCALTTVAHLDALFARIWVYDPKDEVLVLHASAGLYTHLDGGHARMPLGHMKIGVIAADRKPHLTNQVVGDPLISDQEWARREGITAFAGNPLVVGATLIGVMGVFSRRPFSPATSDWLATIAGEIALGIQRKLAEDEIRRSGDEWVKTFDAMPDLVFTVAPDYRIEKANRAMLARFGLQRDQIIGKHCYELLHHAAAPAADCPHRLALLDGQEHSAEIHEPLLGGDFLLSVSPLVNAPGCPGGVVHVAHDISERRHFEQRLQAAAFTDELTGLFNRRGFFTLAGKQVEIARRGGHAVGLVYLDVDRFKEINDRWGHKEGDRALQDVAAVLRQTFRKSDILGRIGGDEFVVFLPEAGDAGSQRAVLSNLRQTIVDHHAHVERPFTLELSAGVAFSAPGAVCRLEELLLRADRDMYREKRLGKAHARSYGQPSRPGQSPRLTSRIPLEGVLAEVRPGGTAQVVDISLGGVCLRTPASLQVRNSYGVMLPAGAADSLDLSAEVMWAEEIGGASPAGYRFQSGLRFMDVDGKLKGVVSELVAGHC